MTDGNFILRGGYGIDKVSDASLTLTTAVFGYHTPLMDKTDLILGIGYTDSCLSKGGASGGKSNTHVDLELARILMSKTSVSARLVMEFLDVSYGLVLGTVHKINDFVAINLSLQPDNDAKITSLSLRFSLM
jgi:hypothetical protein